MKTITITDAKHQDKINELSKALVHLREAMIIVKGLAPTRQDQIDRPAFCDVYYESESSLSLTICNVSSALSEFVREDVTDMYMQKLGGGITRLYHPL